MNYSDYVVDQIFTVLVDWYTDLYDAIINHVQDGVNMAKLTLNYPSFAISPIAGSFYHLKVD